MIKFVLMSMALAGTSAMGATNHTLYYKGILHYTDLTGHATVPADHLFVLKKDILPSQGKFVETATLPDYTGKISDLTTSVAMKGNSVIAQATDGSAIGTGTIAGVGPDGDFTYLNINIIIPANGAFAKDINYITPNKLIARKEIDDSAGVPTMLWESDMDLISASDYQTLYQILHNGN